MNFEFTESEEAFRKEVTSMGGEVFAESVVGEGSRFSFTLVMSEGVTPAVRTLR